MHAHVHARTHKCMHERTQGTRMRKHTWEYIFSGLAHPTVICSNPRCQPINPILHSWLACWSGRLVTL